MKYIIKGIIASCIVINFIYVGKTSTIELILFLSLVTITLLTDLENTRLVSLILIIECTVVFLIGSYTDFVVWSMLILLFDIIYTDCYLFGSILIGELIYFKVYDNSLEIWLIIALVGIVAYIMNTELKKKKDYHDILDTERRTKYELELTKASLIQSNKELQRLTQAKERNRIARDLHDNIGHKIAGILIKLQASKKVLKTDIGKGTGLLEECIIHLQEGLETLRDTVHNMYSHDMRGIDYIEKIVKDYKFCTTSFSSKGNFAQCPERYLEAISYVLKEALTNTAKHSKATEVDVHYDCTEGLLVMEVADNGIGCDDINESLGIRSMRDRIKSLDGSFSINGNDGMKIKCIIPL